MERFLTSEKTQLSNNSVFFKPVIQKKLSVGASNDAFETEADSMANKVMGMTEPSETNVSHSGALVQRKCTACEEEKVRTKPLVESIQRFSGLTNEASTASNHVENKINSSKGGGSSMDNGTRDFMETRFGTDFSNVRIHTGSEAIQMSRELNAQAFTVGNDVYFNEGKYNPNVDSGKHLLAHELTHTIQQGVSEKMINKCNNPTGNPVVRDDCGESGPADRHNYITDLNVDVDGQNVEVVWSGSRSNDNWLCSPHPSNTPRVRDVVGKKCSESHTNRHGDGMSYLTALSRYDIQYGFHNSQTVATGVHSHGCIRVSCSRARIINRNSWSGRTRIHTF